MTLHLPAYFYTANSTITTMAKVVWDKYGGAAWIWFLIVTQAATETITKVHTYDKSSCVPGPHRVTPINSAATTSTRPEVAPPLFRVRFTVSTLTTNVDDPIDDNNNDNINPVVQDDHSFILQVNRTWAPIGVDQFYQLILDNYYDCAAFFRVVPGTFWLQ
jgi:hypothetical protein